MKTNALDDCLRVSLAHASLTLKLDDVLGLFHGLSLGEFILLRLLSQAEGGRFVYVRVAKGFDWQKQPAIVKAKSEAERALGANGRVLLRPSGTEPVLRVMVEGKDDAEVRRLAKMIADTVGEAA